VDVEVTPRHLSFGQLGKNEKATREFKIAVREPDKVKVVEVKTEDDRFVLKKIDGVLESNSTWEITFKGTGKKVVVKTKVADPKGDYSKPSRHALKVFTGDPDESEVDIRYTISNRLPGRQPHMRKRGIRRGDRGGSGISAPLGKPLTVDKKKEGEAPK
jgi:hypothetical protein